MFWFLLPAVVLVLFYYIGIKPHKYWSNRGIQQTNPLPIFGDVIWTLLRREAFADFVYRVYNNFSDNTRYFGIYQLIFPSLIIKDPELVQQIAIKDFDHFVDHSSSTPEDVDPLWNNNLFSLKGNKWRDMRATLSPSFTASKMKNMFTLMTEVGKNFVKHFEKKTEDIIEIEMKDVASRFTCDVIANTAFGIQVDSLEDKKNEFYVMGSTAFKFSDFWTGIKFFISVFLPALSNKLRLRLFSKEVGEFFTKVVTETIQYREKNNIKRPDMLQLLMEAKKANMEHNQKVEQVGTNTEDAEKLKESGVKLINGELRTKSELSVIEIAAQALVFFAGGFDTVASQMCFSAHELAVNPEIQQRLYEEIKEAKDQYGNDITYDAIMRMNYLDMVVLESQRKWPVATMLDRKCIKPYTIEPVLPNEKPVHIKAGDSVFFPIWAFHRDPRYFENPTKFDPERFSPENKHKIVPGTFAPFGIGPRMCIANRFANMEIKAILYYLLGNYEIVPTKKTQIPLMPSKSSIQLAAEGGFWLGLKKRHESSVNKLF